MKCYLKPMFYVSSGTSLERNASRSTQHRTRREDNFSWRTHPRTGTTAPCRPALPLGAPRHCRPGPTGTAGQSTPALPAQEARHCRPDAFNAKIRPRPALPPLDHRHYRPLKVNDIWTVRLNPVAVYFSQMTKLPIPRSRLYICLCQPRIRVRLEPRRT
jgi:hypothetical protein